MKLMRINSEIMEIEFDDFEKANRLYEGLYNWEQDQCQVEGGKFSYNLTGVEPRHIGLVLKDFFRKTCKSARIERTLVDRGEAGIKEVFEAIIDDGKLFQITLINKHGTIGKTGFGCWQYGRILTITSWEDTFRLEIRNSNLDDARPSIVFEEGITLVIEIGEIQF